MKTAITRRHTLKMAASAATLALCPVYADDRLARVYDLELLLGQNWLRLLGETIG